MITMKPGNYINEYYGLTTDTKPTDPYLPNASIFYEMDTGDIYLYDAANGEWVLQPSSDGGGGGGGSVETDKTLTRDGVPADAKAAGDRINAVKAAIAPEFDEDEYYSANTPVWHDGTLYVILSEHESGVSWEDIATLQIEIGDTLKNIMTELAGSGGGDGSGEVLFEPKLVPIHLTSNSGDTINLTEDQMREIDNAISSISEGCIPYLDVSFTGGMVPSHSLFFYGHKETNPYALTFVGGTKIALYTGQKIRFADMERPKLHYSTTYNDISWNRSGADVFVKCETARSSFTDRYVDIPLYVKPDYSNYNFCAPIFNLTQNKMAGYVKVGANELEFFWFDNGAASTDRIAFSTNYRTGDSWLYPDS